MEHKSTNNDLQITIAFRSTRVHPFFYFGGARVTWTFVLYVSFVDRCLFFCLFPLAIVLSFLRFTDSDCPFGIFKLFFVLSCLNKNYMYNIKCIFIVCLWRYHRYWTLAGEFGTSPLFTYFKYFFFQIKQTWFKVSYNNMKDVIFI